MTFVSFEASPQLFVFETFVYLVIIISCLHIFKKTDALYRLSLQKGIRYFSAAFAIFTVCFSLMYLYFLVKFFSGADPMIGLSLIIVSHIALFLGVLGGLYLAYSLVWRRFECDSTACLKSSRLISMITISAVVAIVDMYFYMAKGVSVNLYFYVMMIILGGAILHNWKHHKRKGANLNPFISSAVLSLWIYFGIFIESYVFPFFPTVHYYIWGLLPIVFHAVAHNVTRVIDGNPEEEE